MHGIVIAGTHSGCGKTTVALGVLAALKKKGLDVRSFKAGPDFIDSGLHRLASGTASRNLDLWMCGEDYVRDCFSRHSAVSDAAVVEGVMGMYDGNSSTAKLAFLLGLPVILVVDAYGMAESAGAVVKGFNEYRAEGEYLNTATSELPGFWANLAGVIFNRVGSERHYDRLRCSVRGVPVLGYLPRNASFEVPHRHLGLTTAEEGPLNEDVLDDLAETVLEFIDMDQLLKITAKDTEITGPRILSVPQKTSSPVRIGIAYDKAFCFYYDDNLDLLTEAGAELVRFSPLEDHRLPDGLDALYIGGGYPELFARELAANTVMLSSVREWCSSGRPVYAECGGLMYLSRGIYDFKGAFFVMADVLPFATAMQKGRANLGYREIELSEDCILAKKGSHIRGHEFHYSEIQGSKGEVNTIYQMSDSLTGEGYRSGNTLASYVHVHFGSNPAIAGNFISFIRETKWKA